MTVVDRTHLAYRFGFDDHGFYTGLVYKNSLGLFPSNCTPVEPPWINGRVPVWSFEASTWVPIMRSERRLVESNLDFLKYHSKQAIEAQGEAFKSLGMCLAETGRIQHEETKELCDLVHELKLMLGTQNKMIQLVINNLGKLNAGIEVLDFTTKEIQLKVFEPKPLSWWQKLKNWLGWKESNFR